MSSYKYVTFDEVFVNEELINFYNTIKLKNPMLIGKPIDWRKQTTLDKDNNKIEIMNSMFICHASKPSIVVGKISYWDKTYRVNSRLIKNEKFAHWNKEDYHSKSSVHMKNMIKVAIEKLVPLTVIEIAEKSRDRTTIHNDIHEIRKGIGRDVSMALNKIDDEIWFKELLHMYNTGYKPESNKVKDLINFALSKKEEYDNNYSYNPNVLFVYIEDSGVVKTLDDKESVMEYPNIKSLSEDVLGKVMVLMVTPEQTFVRDIGKKDTSNSLWVLV